MTRKQIFTSQPPGSYPLRGLGIICLLLLTAAACQQTSPTPTPRLATAVPTPLADNEQPSDGIAQSPLYLNPDLPTAERVEDLLRQMTLEEKIGQMTLIEKNSLGPRDVGRKFIGAVLSGGGGYPSSQNNPESWREMVTAYQEAALATRLGIPILYGVDAVHGHGNLKGSVIFPHNIGLGATRNPELMERIGRVTAVETAATGIFWNYAPVLAVPQDIRWGRFYEGYSENTALVSELGTAYLRGLQQDDLSDPTTILGTPKHFVGDGGTVFGSSKTGNYQIDQGDTQVDEATLRAVYLPPYQSVIDAGARSIMVSFSSWNGTKMHANAYLLTDVLKEEMGFSGFLVSDWAGIDQITPDYYQSVVTAVNAGIDMNMVPYDASRFQSIVQTAVATGDIPEERIDDAVSRILTAKFELGLFENPYPDPSLLERVGSSEHRAVAQEAVSQSLVLLQNENEVLPIAKDAKIFVAGPFADDIGVQSGGWTIEWQGKQGAITPGTTILDAIEATAVGEVTYNKYGSFDNTESPADVGIVVIGERPYAEGVGDASDLNLSAGDVELINRVKDKADKVVVILLAGRPLIITDQLPLADAWIAAWLPGTEGQGMADNLFGDHPFTGQLPFTWPASMDQLPLGSYDDEPLFPYGYGITTGEEISASSSTP